MNERRSRIDTRRARNLNNVYFKCAISQLRINLIIGLWILIEFVPSTGFDVK